MPDEEEFHILDFKNYSFQKELTSGKSLPIKWITSNQGEKERSRYMSNMWKVIVDNCIECQWCGLWEHAQCSGLTTDTLE